MHVRNISQAAGYFRVGGVGANIERNNIQQFPDTAACREGIRKYITNGSMEFVDPAGVKIEPPSWYKPVEKPASSPVVQPIAPPAPPAPKPVEVVEVKPVPAPIPDKPVVVRRPTMPIRRNRN